MKSVADHILRRLQKFANDLEAGKPLMAGPPSKQGRCRHCKAKAFIYRICEIAPWRVMYAGCRACCNAWLERKERT